MPLISLTGSREVGVKTAENGAAYLKHIHLELGGKNAIIVMDDADLDLAVEGILWPAFGTSGQRCTAASRVIAGKSVYDALTSKLVEQTEKLRLGDGLEDPTDVGLGREPRRPGEDPLVHGDRQGRGRDASPAARSRPRTASIAGRSTGRPSSATWSRECGLPRRRSSDRRPR